MFRRLLVVLPLAAIMLCVTSTESSSASSINSPLSLAGLPSKPTQIKTLEKAEQRIDEYIAARGVGNANFDQIPLGDLRSFNVEPLWNKGIDGAGTTVAVIEAWNDPRITSLVDSWSHRFGLPNPKITTIYPAGALPAKCPAGMQALREYGSCSSWRNELTLDVEAVHLLAPYAKIVISATPADTQIQDDRSSQVAPPEMMEALEYISNRHLADVISISDGSNEGDYSHGPAEILAQDPGELTAAAAGIPVVDATGDCGAAQELATGDGLCNDVTPGRAIATWDDSPFVLAVGGNTPAYTYAGPHGQDSFTVWNVGRGLAEGAGVSSIYPIPSYQSGVASVIGTPWRAVPDITMGARNDATSQATQEFGAVLALATQVRGGHLGPINKVLYEDLGRKGAAAGIMDITTGNNSAHGVTGYRAGRGYDVATGWGTINAAIFVPALASAMAHEPERGSLAQQARDDLNALEQTGKVEPSVVSASGTLTVTSSGFLPEHPVTVSVDGKLLQPVYADGNADLSFSVPLASLGLQAGEHKPISPCSGSRRSPPATSPACSPRSAGAGSCSSSSSGCRGSGCPCTATASRPPRCGRGSTWCR